MSTSETCSSATQSINKELHSIALRLRELVHTSLTSTDVSLDQLSLLSPLFTPLVRLYAAVTEETGREITPVSETVTATEVVTMSCALLRAQDLNPFDLAIWFSRAPAASIANAHASAAALPSTPSDSKENIHANL